MNEQTKKEQARKEQMLVEAFRNLSPVAQGGAICVVETMKLAESLLPKTETKTA